MRPSLALAHGSQAAAGGLIPVMPDELAWDLTAESALGTVDHGTGFAADTGQMMNTISIGSNGSIGASSLDSENVYNSSPVGASYFCTVNPMPGRVVYMRGKFRFNKTGASVEQAQFAIIPWNKRTLSGDLAASHFVYNTNTDTAFVQVVTDGGGTFTTIGGPWAITHPTPGQELIVEYVIDAPNDAMVVRLPDGSTEGFTDAALGAMVGLYPCWEPFYDGAYASNKWDAEVLELQASTISGASDAQLAYINALLATEGFGPLSRPQLSTIEAIGTAEAASAPNGTYAAYPGGGGFTCGAGDRRVALTFNDDGVAVPDPISGYSTIDTLAGNLCAMTFQQAVAAGSETQTGAAGVADNVMGVVLSDCGGVGNYAMTQGAGSTLTVAALTCSVTDGTSRVMAIAIHHDDAASVPGMSTPPSGMSLLKNDTSFTANTVCLYEVTGGSTGYAGGTISAGTVHSWKTIVFELLGG